MPAANSGPPIKPGWTTSEFWVTVATQVIGLAVALAPLFGRSLDSGVLTPLVPAASVLAAAIATAFYSHSRGRVKSASLSLAPATAGPLSPPAATSEGSPIPAAGSPSVPVSGPAMVWVQVPLTALASSSLEAPVHANGAAQPLAFRSVR